MLHLSILSWAYFNSYLILKKNIYIIYLHFFQGILIRAQFTKLEYCRAAVLMSPFPLPAHPAHWTGAIASVRPSYLWVILSSPAPTARLVPITFQGVPSFTTIAPSSYLFATCARSPSLPKTYPPIRDIFIRT